MLPLPEELQTRLDSGVTTLAWCWRVTRRDGAVFGFTEHDGDLVVDGLTCRAASGFAPGERDGRADLGADQASVFGALSDEAITEADLANGLWDGARVDVLRVDWQDPSVFAPVWTGEIGETRRGKTAFEAELRGLSARLERVTGRVYSRQCDAEIGDARCGVDLENPAFRGEGSAASVSGGDLFVADGLGGFDAGLFSGGLLTWTSGGNAGAICLVEAHRVSGGVVTLQLTKAPAQPIAQGDAFTVTAGCDKRHGTCRDRFSNIVNFRGHPFLPGNDVLIAGPAGDMLRDGSSRGGAR